MYDRLSLSGDDIILHLSWTLRSILLGNSELYLPTYSLIVQIPAAFRLITLVFHDPTERGRAITVFSLSGAVANAAGLILASVFGLIPATTGQMSGWRWYFRFIALTAFPCAIASHVFIPRTKPTTLYTTREKWKRFDLPGCAILLLATLLFILSLTLGATYGWKTPKFLVPFCLCWPAFVIFAIWEKKQPEGFALIPPSTWRIRNVSLLLVISISAFAYWPVSVLMQESG
jgi:MFS family permease